MASMKTQHHLYLWIPPGYKRVTAGFVERNDLLLNVSNATYETPEEYDLGIAVRELYCVIRPVNPVVK